MKAVVQRVSKATVRVDGDIVGAIERGLLVLLGVAHGDDADTAKQFATKVASLRVFEDAEGRMNLSCAEVDGAVLGISQFTLLGDVRRGRRPSFAGAAPPELAEPLYETFCAAIEAAGLRCERGRFGAHMDVALVNDGPVTLVLDSDDLQRPRRT